MTEITMPERRIFSKNVTFFLDAQSAHIAANASHNLE